MRAPFEVDANQLSVAAAIASALRRCSMDEVDEILALNALHEKETSPLTRPQLVIMLAGAFQAATAGQGRDGYMIAFDQDADYDSENFRWFKARYARFVYVDRIVVAERARGKGLARGFYQHLFDRALSAGHDRVVCEINVEPPNPGSMLFHETMGFCEVGRATISNGKQVSYQSKMV
jgi:predicted GNAT superfamily acetyltransferase